MPQVDGATSLGEMIVSDDACSCVTDDVHVAATERPHEPSSYYNANGSRLAPRLLQSETDDRVDLTEVESCHTACYCAVVRSRGLDHGQPGHVKSWRFLSWSRMVTSIRATAVTAAMCFVLSLERSSHFLPRLCLLSLLSIIISSAINSRLRLLLSAPSSSAAPNLSRQLQRWLSHVQWRCALVHCV